MLLRWKEYVPGQNSFRANFNERVYAFLWLSDGLLKKEDKVWCWVLRDENHNGINGGCADTKKDAITQAEQALITKCNANIMADLKYISLYAEKLSKDVSTVVVEDRSATDIRKALNLLRDTAIYEGCSDSVHNNT